MGARAMRNIPGVDLCSVERLNLLQLAPGGTFGRFCVWTESAMKRLGELFGTYKGGSKEKKGYTLPRSLMTNTDISRIINSTEVQSALKPAKALKKVIRQRKNPLKNKGVMGRLCPMAVNAKKLNKKTNDGKTKEGAAKLLRVKKTAAGAKKHTKDKKKFFKALLDAYPDKKMNLSGTPVAEAPAEE